VKLQELVKKIEVEGLDLSRWNEIDPSGRAVWELERLLNVLILILRKQKPFLLSPFVYDLIDLLEDTPVFYRLERGSTELGSFRSVIGRKSSHKARDTWSEIKNKLFKRVYSPVGKLRLIYPFTVGYNKSKGTYVLLTGTVVESSDLSFLLDLVCDLVYKWYRSGKEIPSGEIKMSEVEVVGAGTVFLFTKPTYLTVIYETTSS